MMILGKYEPLCRIQLRSLGWNDRHKAEGPAITINGKVVKISKLRGFTFATIRDDCSLSDIKHFDTYASKTSSNNMKSFLLGLPENTKVVGVTYDEFSKNLGPAKSVLTKLGVNVPGGAWRASLSLAFTKGHPEKTKQSFTKDGQGPAFLTGFLH